MFDPIPGYRRAVVKTSQRTGNTPRRPDLPARYVFHVTVGVRLYDYPYPPQFTVAWGGGNSFAPGTRLDLRSRFVEITGDPVVVLDEGDVLALQHCDVTKTGYALEGPGAPPRSAVETNHAGHALQCEFTCPPARRNTDFADWEYHLIALETARQIRALRDETGDRTAVDTRKIRDWKGSSAWGYDDPYEMSDAEWLAYDGLCGHVDVPGNAHWDPGDWDHFLLSSLITAYLEEPTMNVLRLAGSSRYDTCRLAFEFAWQPDDIALARGDDFADLGGALQAPRMLITDPDVLVGHTRAALMAAKAANPDVRVVILGGTAAVSMQVQREVENL